MTNSDRTEGQNR